MSDFVANHQIKSSFVMLIDEDGSNLGNKSKEKAMALAIDRGLDLIKVSDGKDFPICRLGDLGKIKYKESKKEKKNTKDRALKEIRFHLHTAKHDIDIKNKKVLELLHKKHMVKYAIELNGREINHKNQALGLIRTNIESFRDSGTFDEPVSNGRYVSVLIRPIAT